MKFWDAINPLAEKYNILVEYTRSSGHYIVFKENDKFKEQVIPLAMKYSTLEDFVSDLKDYLQKVDVEETGYFHYRWLNKKSLPLSYCIHVSWEHYRILCMFLIDLLGELRYEK